jgi:hypothetical protein
MAKSALRVGKELISGWQLDFDVSVPLQSLLDSGSYFPQKAIRAIGKDTLEVNKDGDVLLTQPVANLVENRGLSNPALAIQDNKIVLLPVNESLPDRTEDIIAAQEQLFGNDRIIENVGINGVFVHSGPPEALRWQRKSATIGAQALPLWMDGGSLHLAGNFSTHFPRPSL